MPPGDPQALAAAIQGALENPEDISTIAEQGRKFALEHFAWSVTQCKFEALYGTILTGD